MFRSLSDDEKRRAEAKALQAMLEHIEREPARFDERGVWTPTRVRRSNWLNGIAHCGERMVRVTLQRRWHDADTCPTHQLTHAVGDPYSVYVCNCPDCTQTLGPYSEAKSYDYY